MGGGFSLTKENVIQHFQQSYKNNPELTVSILTLCQQHTEEHKRKMAMNYAKRMCSNYFPVPSGKEIACSFTLLDYNGNGIVSLAEIDKYIVERYPSFNNKPALIRAMHAADSDKDGFITKDEYSALYQYIHLYHKLWNKFETMDANGDRRIDRSEFNALTQAVLGEEATAELFEKIDVNSGGKILFREFCDHIIGRLVCRQGSA